MFLFLLSQYNINNNKKKSAMFTQKYLTPTYSKLTLLRNVHLNFFFHPSSKFFLISIIFFTILTKILKSHFDYKYESKINLIEYVI